MSTESFNTPAVTFTAPNPGETTAPEVVNPGPSVEQEPPENQEPKTFTQEEVDRIIGERLAKERRRLEKEQREAAQRPQVVEPDPRNFRTQQEYDQAYIDYRVAAGIEQQKRVEQQTSAMDKFIEKVDYKKYPDFDKVVRENDSLPITEAMRDVIIESDIGPDIAYHLAQNPGEASRIAAIKNPAIQGREISKIEAKLIANPPAPVKGSSAPEPVQPVGSRASSPKYSTSDPRSIKQLSDSEWIEQRRQELMKRGQR